MTISSLAPAETAATTKQGTQIRLTDVTKDYGLAILRWRTSR